MGCFSRVGQVFHCLVWSEFIAPSETKGMDFQWKPLHVYQLYLCLHTRVIISSSLKICRLDAMFHFGKSGNSINSLITSLFRIFCVALKTDTFPFTVTWPLQKLSDLVPGLTHDTDFLHDKQCCLGQAASIFSKIVCILRTIYDCLYRVMHDVLS